MSIELPDPPGRDESDEILEWLSVLGADRPKAWRAHQLLQRYRATLEMFERQGMRVDESPTMADVHEGRPTEWWYGYLRDAGVNVRAAAWAALTGKPEREFPGMKSRFPYSIRDVAEELFDLDQKVEQEINKLREDLAAKIGPLSDSEVDAVIKLAARIAEEKRGPEYAKTWLRNVRKLRRASKDLPEDGA